LSANSAQVRWPYVLIIPRSPVHRIVHISTSNLFMRLFLSNQSWGCVHIRTVWVRWERKKALGWKLL
jgi:hypothetical protein